MFRVTLDEGLMSRVQWNRAVLLAESHKWPLESDHGLREWPVALESALESDLWQIKAKLTWHHLDAGPRP
jgi:hypothetical protein